MSDCIVKQKPTVDCIVRHSVFVRIEWNFPLLEQFKSTISNQHIKMTKSTHRTGRAGYRHRRWRILSPKLPIYSSFACTVNAHEIDEPEVAKGSFSQFFFFFLLFIVTSTFHVVRTDWTFLRPMEMVGQQFELAAGVSVAFSFFSTRFVRRSGRTLTYVWVPYVPSSCADCRLIHGIYFIRRLCTLLASIRCTFLCCARSTSSVGHHANIILFTM